MLRCILWVSHLINTDDGHRERLTANYGSDGLDKITGNVGANYWPWYIAAGAVFSGGQFSGTPLPPVGDTAWYSQT